MKKSILHWYEYAVFIAGAITLILGIGNWNQQQTALLLGLIIIHLHFFEEFGLPGGFAWGGIKVEKGKVADDVATWPLNQLSSLWGNEWFAITVYLLPLFTPKWHWTVLAALVFAYAELLMHVVVFNIGLKSWYNPGTVTALFGLTVVSTWYLWTAVPTGLFSWWDLVIAIVWIGFNYWMAFRSPITYKLNAYVEYRFSKEDVMKAKAYMNKFPGASETLFNFREDQVK